MPTLTDRDIADLMIGTLANYGPPRFQQIAQELQYYEVMSKWLKRDKVTFDGGHGIKRTLLTRTGQSAQHIGLAEEDTVSIVDLLEQIDVPWRHLDANWAFIRQETLINRGKALVTNIVKPRRTAALIDIAQELEEKAWSSPSATNKTDPYGIPYWVVRNANTGFYGGLPAGHTTIAGIDLDAVPQFKNYTAIYTAISRDDLVRKMRAAHLYCGFKSPVTVQEFRRNQRYRVYCGYEEQLSIEDVATNQNENLGPDVASMDGLTVFKRIPILGIPILNGASGSPVYMIDHNTFYPVVLRGDYLRESEPKIASKQHNVFECFIDLSYNYICLDRRRNAVIATAA